ncbi:alpha/beta fold hydrolase [Variovorax paradoxus]|uniref:alpha/beta fold hydrolase n=1 Tax=Variovorax paradoxus TaxID=34073 RepID=UPI002788C260|nr:alpha/beta hydrolase [Variovorax paradoxus]MDQ0589923.1 pimeloyl-ACP methyl ester carboxylesterase [Variovorax paradoxus]
MKTPLILVSGMLCDATVWEPTTTLLHDAADIRVMTLGGTDSVGAMADRVLAAAPAQFALAGHSLGGRVALEVVRRAPQRVRLLGLFGTAYKARAPGEAGQSEIAAREAMVARAKAEGLAAFAPQWVSRMVDARWAAQVDKLQPLIAMVARQSLEDVRAQVRMGLSRPDFSSMLPDITCPTLVLAARGDAAMPLPPHEEMAAAIPAGYLAVVEDSGHLMTFEQPQACAAAIRPWLAGFSLIAT